MYFILSKVLLFLLFPINWIITLLLIAAFTRRKKLRKRTAVTGAVLLLIFSNTYLCNCFGHAWEMGTVKLPDNAHYSCAIVLGGFTSELNGKEGHFNGASDRFIEAMKLQITGKASHILISGGNGNLDPGAYAEAEWVKGQLKEMKFADSTVLIESKSRNTIENARLSAALLKKSGLKPPYLLVTSGYHMRRALMIFKNTGVDVVPYPCDLISGKVGRLSFFDLLPNFEALGWWDTTIKEIWGYLVNSLMKTND